MVGSVWNKWDLHVHSPLTWLQNGFGAATIKDFVDEVVRTKVSVIGLTNYFFFRENELELVRSEIEKQGQKITVLGNVEFRITAPNKDGEWINIHCLFNQQLSSAKINEVLSTLKVVNTTKDGLNIFCSEKAFAQANLKVDEAVVELRSLIQHFHSSLIYGTDFVLAACPNGYGGFRPDQKEGRSRAIAVEIEKECSLMFGRPTDRNFFLNSERYAGAVPKPVFFASDAHQLKTDGVDEKLRTGVCSQYTWVKAYPTFEGLRQAIIEPELRVQQLDGFIEQQYRKPHFTQLRIGGPIFDGQMISFDEQTLPLNPNLVTIIGGRGTGKSLLLDSLGSLFDLGSNAVSTQSVSVKQLEATLDLGAGEVKKFEQKNSPYSYLHVTQGEIKKLTNTPQNLSAEIKRMLGLQASPFDPSLVAELRDNFNSYRSFVDFRNQTDDRGNRINTPEFQNQIIEQNERLIATLTNPENRALIERYVQNSTQINERSIYVQELQLSRSNLERFVQDYNSQLAALSANKHKSIDIPRLELLGIAEAIDRNVLDNQVAVENLTQDNNDIVHQFESLGIHQDITSLLGKIAEYQYLIDAARQKLIEIQAEAEKWKTLVARRTDIVKSYLTFSNDQSTTIDATFKSLTLPRQGWNSEQNDILKSLLADTNIFGAVFFSVDLFYAGIEQHLNRGKFKATNEKSTKERLAETFNVRSIADFESLIRNEARIIVDGKTISIEDLFWRQEFFNTAGQFGLLEYIFSPAGISEYLQVNAEFKYKNKTLDKLSVGQRGTFFVCLKLATDPFGTPFVFDQPEDDLDNEFIMDELVPIFRSIKKYRQVIIATHNANLVVNTDAEQIIVATNTEEHIRYLAGAIEDGSIPRKVGIRYHICKILEGGRPAFEKRELKYGLQIDG